MKNIVSLAIIGASLALTACSNTGSADYSYESQAPYADERTVGSVETPVKKADTIFQGRQAK